MQPQAKTVTLKITGNSADNLSIELEIRRTDDNKLVCDRLFCPLSPLPPELLKTYQAWRKSYLNWGEAWGRWLTITPPSQPIETNVSIRVVDRLSEQLVREFNEWLSLSRELARIRENIVEYVPPSEYRNYPGLLSLVVHTNTNDPVLNLNLQKLPWHEWEFVCDRYQTGVALSTNIAPIVSPHAEKFKALAICGHYLDPQLQVDLTGDLTALQAKLGAKVDLEIWIADPSQCTKSQLLQKLRTETYHLLFFSGHSSADRRIQLNDNEYISTNDRQLIQILRNLKERGLILTFFNSCDGLGIAENLMSVGIPYIVVMKELVHDRVAQEFIQIFLENATQDGIPIHIAIDKARQELNSIEELPHGSFLPVLFQNPEQPAFYLTAAIPRIKNPSLPNQSNQVNWKSKMIKLPPIGYLAIGALALYAVKESIGSIANNKSLCDNVAALERVSCCEKILLAPPGGKIRGDKEVGFAAFKEKDYHRAIESLQRDWNVAKDPETLIALNNAKLAVGSSQQIKTIAVVIPSRQTPIFVATNLLKGVAAAQDEWNQTNREWKLRVVIADDSNDPNEGKKIVDELVKHSELLAVLGHYSSNVTTEVKDIYRSHQMVLLSPTSTSDELTTTASNSYFFRVASSNRVSIKQMSDLWAKKYDKIALFYTPNKKFSESLRKEFLATIPTDTIVKEFDLTVANNAAVEIAQAKAAGAKAIVLFPDAYTDAIERDRVLSIVKANRGQLPILGDSILADAYLFQVDPQWLKNLTISLPIHPSDRRYIDVGKLNRAPNWWGSKSQIHDRIINSYDGMQVLLAALNKSNHREEIDRAIGSPNFSVRGITGKISFQGSDRAEPIDTLVIPNCDATKCEGFKPVY